MPEQLELATAEVLGALAYGQLRSFQVTARAVALAPDARTADELAELAVREHAGYALLRDTLARHTDLPAAVMDRQKPYFDDYFDRVQMDDWFAACAFFALGLPIAADFGRELAASLDPETALVVVASLADRGPFERFATAHLRRQLGDETSCDRARQLVAHLLGWALQGFQGVVSDTDALKVVLASGGAADGESGETRVKRLAIGVMQGHHRRMIDLGLEDLEEII
ncbi:ferritin-like fold-containing protein [Egicoccus sp. AB-alg6-2]|uniref:ferritin-like fold-containing protein n=1 Tax=Egicoccus sp. AB-alg6-2 TaxID=3242692 RepID=UPI00359F0F5E